jgi:hypothetical protein
MHANLRTPRRHTVAHLGQPPLLLAAAIVTIAAASLAWLLATVAHLPENVIVITVMVLAFLASWNVTNHRPVRHHRVTVIQARVRTH